ncbi:MAG: methyltransferase domain-containing protein [Chloroflexaceae bacterium]|nr:methyltransferase domain-containing protein [Chloroflexaceae bacterium]
MTTGPEYQLYDAIPYPHICHVQTHPDRLATLAWLRGIEPAPANCCRVLDLGCGSGINSIAMAELLPESRFVGIDRAEHQIWSGREIIDVLGLENVTLHHGDFCEIDANWGKFDYILVHGVYSWVGRDVRDTIMRLCRDHLNPHGIAYISYNTYPGWHAIGMLREMMRYHTRALDDPYDRSQQALELLDFLADAVVRENPAFGRFVNHYLTYIRKKLARVGSEQATLLLYDELADVNEPVYIHAFLEHAAQYGLQYVTESDMASTLALNLEPTVAEHLQQLARTMGEYEQYLDFVRCRMFRETLLCHDTLTLRRQLTPDVLERCCLASPARLLTGVADTPIPLALTFVSDDGARLVTDHGFSQAAMMCLIDLWPQAVPFDTLCEQAQSRLLTKEMGHLADDQTEYDRAVLRATLLKGFCCSSNLVQLSLMPPAICTTISERPRARRLARWQAHHGPIVTNLYHEDVRLEAVRQRLLCYLDGKHTLDDVQRKFPELATGDLLAQHLAGIARSALLVG